MEIKDIMKFYEFNSFEYYALIGASTMEEAIKEYENTIADIDEEDGLPDLITEEEAKNIYWDCFVDQSIEDVTYEEIKDEFNKYKEDKEVYIFLIDSSLL